MASRISNEDFQLDSIIVDIIHFPFQLETARRALCHRYSAFRIYAAMHLPPVNYHGNAEVRASVQFKRVIEHNETKLRFARD